MLKAEELDRLEKLEREATAGPWRSDSCGDIWTEAEKELCPGFDQELFRVLGATKRGPDRGDAAAIAALRNAAPALIAAAREGLRLREENAAISKLDDKHRLEVVATAERLSECWAENDRRAAEVARLKGLVEECAHANTVDEAWEASERCYDYLDAERRAALTPEASHD